MNDGAVEYLTMLRANIERANALSSERIGVELLSEALALIQPTDTVERAIAEVVDANIAFRDAMRADYGRGEVAAAARRNAILKLDELASLVRSAAPSEKARILCIP